MRFSFQIYDTFFSIKNNKGFYINASEATAHLVPEETRKKYTSQGRFINIYGDIDTSNFDSNQIEKYANFTPEPLTSPIEASIDRLASTIQTKGYDCVYYTGAGISSAAGVPTMNWLKKELILTDPSLLCYKSVFDPNYFISRFRFFCFRLALCKPTAAHKALSEIIRLHGGLLVTENLDKLHEQSGDSVQDPFSNNSLYDLTPSLVILLGIGDPNCTKLLKNWQSKGAEIHAVSLDKPDLRGFKPYFWYPSDIQKFAVKLLHTIPQ